ncbi:MAG: 2-hydroxyacid dehydrogenase, partial [Ktedonobacterales bacterium]
MGKPRVFVSRIIPDAGLNLIREFCDATIWQEELPPPRETLLRDTRDADGLVSLLTDRIDGELLDACPRLRV